MGLDSAGSEPPQTNLARPLYRDDDDGTQALRLKRLVAVDLPAEDRRQISIRLDRAIKVAHAGWAAMVVGAGAGIELVTTAGIPAAIHRLLGDVRLGGAGGESLLPGHILKRAAALGIVVEHAPVRSRDGIQGFVVLGFPRAQRDSVDRATIVQLIADDLQGLVSTSAHARQIERIKSHLSLVHRLGQQVTSIHDSSKLFEEITRLIHRSLGYQHIQLLLTDETTQRIELEHVTGPYAEAMLEAGFSEPIGRGIVGRVAQTGQLWMSQDVTRDAHFVSNALLPSTASELALPLRLGQRVIGVLDIQSDQPHAFRRDDVILLQTIADQIAPAIEQHRLFAAERRERSLADTLAEVSRIISSRLEQSHVLDAVLRQLRRVVPYRGSRVTLRGDDGRMRVVAATGFPDNSKVKQFSFLPEEAPLSSPVMQEHRTLIIGDVRDESRWVWQPGTEQIVSWCSAPLVHGKECIGWLCVDWPEPGFFTAEHGRVVRAFADQSVVAIENARLFERARELSDILEYKVNDRTRQLRDAHDEIAQKATELQALWRRLIDVQEQERQRIAYDLHDSVAQSILASTYKLHAIRRRVADNPDLTQRLIDCQQTLDATLQEMKQIIYALRPTLLDELGLVAALESYAGSLEKHDAPKVNLTIEGAPFPLPPDVELAIFRIVQEACQNSLRHAAGSVLELELEFSDDRVKVRISDDGEGFVSQQQSPGLGLVGIRERSQSVGGELAIDTAPGKGTSVILTVPRSIAA